MTTIGTPGSPSAKKMLLLGSGELGKEIAIEAQRLGLEVIAVDNYMNAPAMHVAHRSHVIDMMKGKELEAIIEREKPHIIVPEIEAIDTERLLMIQSKDESLRVVPTAKATQITMNRKGIRELAAEHLKLPTTAYRFADNKIQFIQAIEQVGYPCVVKPVMSSSGMGQSILEKEEQIESAWERTQSGRGIDDGVIVEKFFSFTDEITLLTIRHKDGTTFCDPIGHAQVGGDYRESWQPHQLTETVLKKAQDIAKKITDALGGYGIFGVELFLKGEEVYFNEVSPRPHDTGLVTLISQDLSQFALHVRAILGLPIPNIKQHGPCASRAIVAKGMSNNILYHNLDKMLTEVDTQLHLFGKPEIHGKRRLGVMLCRAESVRAARDKNKAAVSNMRIEAS